MINVQLPAGVVIQMTVEQLAAYEAKLRGGDNPIKQDPLPLPDVSTPNRPENIEDEPTDITREPLDSSNQAVEVASTHVEVIIFVRAALWSYDLSLRRCR